MKTAVLFTSFSALAIFALVRSLPTDNVKRNIGYGHEQLLKRGSPTDTDILQFALTLEHLENAFYTEGLQKYSDADFAQAGYESWIRGRYQEISDHEATHVKFLTDTIGPQAVQPCIYNFGDTNVSTFVTISDSLEVVGSSAYSGAAHFLTNQDHLTAVAAILATEARQSSWINSAVFHANPWSTAFETPLDLNQVFTIASSLIISCPASNAPLPVQAFPPLQLTSAAVPGQKVSLNFTAPANSSAPLFAAFLSGLTTSTEFVPVQNKTVKIPEDVLGFVFIIITTEQQVNDSVTVAGPALVPFNFGADGIVST